MGLKRNIPKRPVGTTSFHQWCQAVHDRLFKKLDFSDSPTVRVRETQRSISFDAVVPSATSGVAGLTMTWQSSQDNYIVATDKNGKSYNVAKPWWLRRTTYSGFGNNTGVWTGPDGAHTYVYVSADKRTDSVTAPDSSTLMQNSIIWPPYGSPPGAPWTLAGEQILAFEPTGGTGVVDTSGSDITWLESSYRLWAIQVPYCYNGYQGYVMVLSGITTTQI